MLKNGNHKLGKSIYNFNLPRSTCTHRTELCSKYCYAKKGSFLYPSVQGCFDNNYAESLRPDFPARISSQLKAMPDVKYIRLHASGDFFSQQYYNSWNDVAKANPDRNFLAYTRNADIDFSGAAPNFKIYYSIDKTTCKVNKTLTLRSYIFDEGEYPNEHMRYIDDKDSFVCDSKCHSCRYCWAGKHNVSFQLRK